MDFGTNKTPVEIIKEGAFGRTYLETFILVLMVRGIESHEKKIDVLTNIDQEYYCSN